MCAMLDEVSLSQRMTPSICLHFVAPGMLAQRLAAVSYAVSYEQSYKLKAHICCRCHQVKDSGLLWI